MLAAIFGVMTTVLAMDTDIPLWQVVLVTVPLVAVCWYLAGLKQRLRRRGVPLWDRRWARWRERWRQR